MTAKLIFTVITALLLIGTVMGATLTCQQMSDTSLSIAQFSSKNIEIKCTASGGTVSNVQITPNSDPSTGLTISSTQTISSSISASSSSTGKWSVTGDTPNSYTVSYTVTSDGTNSWTGASTTAVTVPSPAQLTVDYVLPPSIFTPVVETLDFKITNIGGTTANNIKMKLNNGGLVDYPTTIAAGASASYSWTNETGFNESGTHTTYVYIGDVLHDSDTVIVNAAGSNQTQAVGWNLISLSKIPSSLAVSDVITDISSEVTILWDYDTSEAIEANRWKRYEPDYPGSAQFTTFDVTRGYWLQAESAVGLSVSGNAHSGDTVEMVSGWNLVGFPSSGNATVSTSISSISSDIEIIWFYDTSEAQEVNRWKRYEPDYPGSAQFTAFQLGYGYWFNTNAATNWTLS